MASYETKRIFAKNLSRLLDEKNISQIELANRIGVAASSVSNWCNGDKMPRMDKIEWMSAFFGVPVTQLLEDFNTNTIKQDILDEIDVAFYGEYKELTEASKETLRAMARVLKEQEDKNK